MSQEFLSSGEAESWSLSLTHSALSQGQDVWEMATLSTRPRTLIPGSGSSCEPASKPCCALCDFHSLWMLSASASRAGVLRGSPSAGRWKHWATWCVHKVFPGKICKAGWMSEQTEEKSRDGHSSLGRLLEDWGDLPQKLHGVDS
jgi:hypothetical protein